MKHHPRQISLLLSPSQRIHSHPHRSYSTNPTCSTPCTIRNTIAYKYIPGLVPYDISQSLQSELVKTRLSQLTNNPPSNKPLPNLLLLLQHPPVYTSGRRQKHSSDTEISRIAALTNNKATYHETLRGGQTTFHGPGQLIGYPILHLKPFNLSTKCYVEYLQKTLINTLNNPLFQSNHQITLPTPASTHPIHTGVWISQNKIAALGVHLQRYISSHGFALNISTDLKWYEYIVPCGIGVDEGLGVARLVDYQSNDARKVVVEDVIHPLVEEFGRVFNSEMRELRDVAPEWDRWVDERVGRNV